MYNRQGLTVGQIWKCSKDYDMWPLFALGLLFGIPKYPVSQYLTLSFRDLGFNVIQSNLLSIPYIVGSSIMMLLITAFSELVNNRSFVSMAEDAWLLPCFAALIAYMLWRAARHLMRERLIDFTNSPMLIELKYS